MDKRKKIDSSLSFSLSDIINKRAKNYNSSKYILRSKSNTYNKSFDNISIASNDSIYKILNSRSKSPNKSLSNIRKSVSPYSNTEKKRRDIAAKSIQKLKVPFYIKNYINLDNRIKIFNLIDKYLKNINILQCLNTDNYITKNQYTINGKKIILLNQIGTESKYGSIFNTRGINEGNIHNMAIKLIPDSLENKNEIDILIESTRKVLAKESIHLPIIYKVFICNAHEINNLLPDNIKNARKYYMILNEYANGDLKTFLNNIAIIKTEAIIKNTFMQIFLAIATFHKKFDMTHNDTHWGNFLYFKVKPGGYIKYKINKKEYYLENLGYLWVIWDFGKAKKITDTMILYKDYKRILLAFISNKNGGWLNDNIIFTTYMTFICKNILKFITHMRKDINIIDQDIEMLITVISNTDILLREEQLPKKAKIYNKIAYVI